MTNEEAIIHLDYLKDFKTPAQVEALNTAIEALKKEPCEDAVSRKVALDSLEELDWDTAYERSQVEKMLKSLPPVTPAPNDDI